jgi:hypothetical protein
VEYSVKSILFILLLFSIGTAGIVAVVLVLIQAYKQPERKAYFFGCAGVFFLFSVGAILLLIDRQYSNWEGGYKSSSSAHIEGEHKK